MRDVAEAAGVSISTVSFVLNDTKPVAPATRARVEAAIATLGYRRNAFARGLASRRTHMIALAHPQLDEVFSPTLIEFITGAAAEARSLGYHVLLVPSDHNGDEVSTLIEEGLVDGVLLMGLLLDDPRVERLRRLNAPFSMIGRNAEPADIPHVDIDIHQAIAEALDHLQGLGHRNIAFITDENAPQSGLSYRARAAYEQLCIDRSLPSCAVTCEHSPRAGQEAIRRIMNAHRETTAVVVQNERAAFGVMSGLGQLGYSVPDQVSVVSVSTVPAMSELVDPELTIVRTPAAPLGSLGIRLVIDILEDHRCSEPKLLPGVLEPGRSTGVARSGY